MARVILAEGEVQVVYCVNRSVSRVFLWGTDALTSKDYGLRRQ